MSGAADGSAAPLAFGGVTPILRVADLKTSLAFYVDALGFAVDWSYRDGFAQVRRGDVALMLCEGDQGQSGTWVYAGVSDADAFHAELCARQVAVRHPPTNYPWGARELQVQDPDGHVLRFASDATGEPFGAWRDGSGTLWLPRPDGSWQAAQDDASDAMTGSLRLLAFETTADELGIARDRFPYDAWGVVMETGVDAGWYTLVVMADGSTSLYFSTGGGIIGSGAKQDVADASRALIETAHDFVRHAQPAPSFEPPANGMTTLYFLTFDGVRSHVAVEDALGEQRDAFWPVFHAAHAVLAAVREAQPGA